MVSSSPPLLGLIPAYDDHDNVDYYNYDITLSKAKAIFRKNMVKMVKEYRAIW